MKSKKPLRIQTNAVYVTRKGPSMEVMVDIKFEDAVGWSLLKVGRRMQRIKIDGVMTDLTLSTSYDALRTFLSEHSFEFSHLEPKGY